MSDFFCFDKSTSLLSPLLSFICSGRCPIYNVIALEDLTADAADCACVSCTDYCTAMCVGEGAGVNVRFAGLESGAV